MTAEEYEQDLEGNLQRLLDRAKSGTYQAPPVRRVHIPKGRSSTKLARSEFRAYRIVKLKTASDRFSRAVRSIDSWCRDHRHWSLSEQQQKLNEKLRGHYAYYGVTGNSGALSRFRWEVDRCWRKWLDRRNRERSMTWDVFRRLLQRYPLAPVRTSRSIYVAQRNHDLRNRML